MLNHPLSNDWKVPLCKNSKEVLTYLLARQQVYFEETILKDFSYKILLRNLKLLEKNYSRVEILRAIEYGCWTSDYVFTTKYIEEMIIQIRDIKAKAQELFHDVCGTETEISD